MDTPFTPRRISLLDLRNDEPTEIQLPTGEWVPVQFFDAPHFQLYKRCKAQGEGTDADVATLLRFALPTVSEADISLLSFRAMWIVLETAAGKADYVLALIEKNGSRPPTPSAERPLTAGPSTPAPSSPKTRSRTRSRGSGASKAATGTPSPRAPST